MYMCVVIEHIPIRQLLHLPTAFSVIMSWKVFWVSAKPDLPWATVISLEQSQKLHFVYMCMRMWCCGSVSILISLVMI